MQDAERAGQTLARKYSGRSPEGSYQRRIETVPQMTSVFRLHGYWSLVLLSVLSATLLVAGFLFEQRRNQLFRDEVDEELTNLRERAQRLEAEVQEMRKIDNYLQEIARDSNQQQLQRQRLQISKRHVTNIPIPLRKSSAHVTTASSRQKRYRNKNKKHHKKKSNRQTAFHSYLSKAANNSQFQEVGDFEGYTGYVIGPWYLANWTTSKSFKLTSNSFGIEINKTGKYFVYAQMTFTGAAYLNMFRIRANNSTLASCITTFDSEGGADTIRTCFTGLIVKLEKLQTLEIIAFTKNIYTSGDLEANLFGLYRI